MSLTDSIQLHHNVLEVVIDTHIFGNFPRNMIYSIINDAVVKYLINVKADSTLHQS